MSKKKKKNKDYYGYLKGKKGKSNKKSMKKASRKFKTLQPTLSKKDGKANRKLICKPVKIDKDFLKSRAKCNHADGTLDIQEFKAMSPTATAYTPMVETLIEVFGEEHVQICARCFEAMVDRDQVTTDTVTEALAVLYAACGIVVANVRMKNDEVKEINKLKETLADFQPVLEFMAELEKKGSRNASASDDSDLNSNAGVEVD